MDRFNILFLNKFREMGGSEVFLVELIKNLDRRRYRPIISLIGETSPECYEILSNEDVEIHKDLFKSIARTEKKSSLFLGHFVNSVFSPQGKRSPYDITAVFRLAKILKDERIDILFYLDKHAALNLAPLAALLARTPVVIGAFHTPELKFSLLEKALFPVTRIVTATSLFHRKYLVESMRIPAEKIKVVNNGISLDLLEQTFDRQQIRETLSLSEESKVVTMVARLVEQKDHDLFLKSAKKILKVCPEAKFLIVGDGPERARLEQFCNDSGLASSVLFLGYRNDVHQLLSISDVSVLATHREFFPYTILESMLMQTPVVATDVGAISEMIAHGETGYLVPPQNLDSLADAIISLLTNEERARKVGAEAQKRVLDHFSSAKMTEQIENIFDKAMAR